MAGCEEHNGRFWRCGHWLMERKRHRPHAAIGAGLSTATVNMSGPPAKAPSIRQPAAWPCWLVIRSEKNKSTRVTQRDHQQRRATGFAAPRPLGGVSPISPGTRAANSSKPWRGHLPNSSNTYPAFFQARCHRPVQRNGTLGDVPQTAECDNLSPKARPRHLRYP